MTLRRRSASIKGRRPCTTLAVAMATATLLASCARTPSVPQLRMSGPAPASEFGVNIVAPRPGAQLSVGTMNLCLDSGSAAVTEARFTEGDLPIEGFAVRSLGPGDTGLGYLPGGLQEHGFPTTSQLVTASCAESDNVDADRAELGITVTSDRTKVLRAKDLVLTYSTDEGSGQLTLPLRLMVCPPVQPAPCQPSST
jgi:hypothetical protein